MFSALQDSAYLGESFALLSALFWAFAVILYRISGRQVHPIGLNVFKSLVCISFLIVTMLIIGETLVPELSLRHYGIMLLSGLIGIGISDTLYFASLNHLGASLSAIINCSYSPSVIIMAALFLGEKMSSIQLLGVMLILTAVVIISIDKKSFSFKNKSLWIGIALGLTAMFSMAYSIIMMKPYLNDSPVLWATLMRNVGGFIFISVVFLIHPQRRKFFTEITKLSNWKAMLPGSIFGGYLAFMAWTGGMKYAQVSVASALNQMSSVFIFILGVLFLKEHVSVSRVVALFIAIIGVILITFY